MILTVTPNPCVDKTLFLDTLQVGEKNVGSDWSAVAGGKGCNVARAVHALRRPATAFVVVGGHSGHHVVDMLTNEDELGCEPVWVQSSTRTITTVLEESAHRQTPLFEPGPIIAPEEVEDILAAFEEMAAHFQIITFNGTVPDRIMESFYARAIPLAKESGAITILDSHGPEFLLGIGAEPAMIKPNLREAEEILGFRLDSRENRWRAVDSFHDKGIELVVISLGPEGALFSRAGERYHARPPEIEEVNAVGSGDAVTAVCAIGLLEDWPLERIATESVAAGTANAMSWDIGHFAFDDVDAIAAQVRIEHP